jgi:Splicing factor SF3a60 binding domain
VEKELDEFYSRLTRVKDFHYRYPSRPIDGFDLELRGIVADPEDEGMDVEVEDRERSPLGSLLELMYSSYELSLLRRGALWSMS